MVTNGDHFVMDKILYKNIIYSTYKNIESLCCTPETKSTTHQVFKKEIN